MGKKEKKRVRELFRNSVFERDGFRCVKCSAGSDSLDAHHITDRNMMPNGGYVTSNGISLCPSCHVMAEQFHSTGEAVSGFSPEELYEAIGSSYDQAVRDAERM